ncbi:hypothetical protein BD324DRAFT_583275 [Kockovaella imperatae]|uniref:C2 domain-containing protein n=1 Tax=Kockovaella imperatae TaxID=4999 RepID=A0A1Y1U8R8_9TREE|nr:hypothetical protein BD324DRAFT_583275 [Kockovaella imperatae]ORX34439.1 hypothetical protein BD324DRAFT_583275 [Kockovaella imperatae]
MGEDKQEKKEKKNKEGGDQGGQQEKPPGGYDPTPLKPSSGPTYTVKITFHGASNIPISDYGSRSCDPYLLAQIDSSLTPRHSRDPPLRFRSQTIHKQLEPKWNAEWVVAGVPASGFELDISVLDEDPDDHDDRLGKVFVSTGKISKDWQGIKEQEFKVKEKGADVFAYGLRWIRAALCRGVEVHAKLCLSMELVGETKEEVGKIYTVNNFWWTHYSPMIGMLTGTRGEDDRGAERFDFEANELQLRGPVPNELYHRYVNFRSFVGGMFEGVGIRGRILHKALHHQHERIYNFNTQTKFGTFPDGPGDAMTLKFLDMVHHDQGGRIFTYVITLDGMFRFTETGKEFGIDLLSKHTMHSDVNIYIAWSGEFFIRRLAHPKESPEAPDQHTHPADDLPNGPPHTAPPKDPSFYELVIDNDSGTYRPEAKLIPIFKKFLEKNFPGLHIEVKTCDDEHLSKMKDQQRKIKKKEGEGRVFGQSSEVGSISSSEVSSLDSRIDDDENGVAPHVSGRERGFEALEHPREALKELIGSPGKGGEKNVEKGGQAS